MKVVLSLFRGSVYLLVLLFVLTLAFGLLVIEDQPTLHDASAPTTHDVTEAREFVEGVRSNITPGGAASELFVASETQINSVAKLAVRLIPGFRGRLAVNETEITGTASIPVPYTHKAKWVNVNVTVPEFDGTMSLSSVELGTISLPPKLSLEIGRVVANLIVGENFGDKVLTAATSMRINDDMVAFGLAMGEMGSNGVMRGVFGTLRGAGMPKIDEINRYYVLIRTAMDRGELPNKGSYLPYLQYTLEAALEGSRTEGVQNAYTSAIFALTRICGAKDITLIAGELAGSGPEKNKIWKTDCGELTLNGRIDSRRHFTTAAAIQAASNSGFAASIGEFKELYDTAKSGGFDFTDIAANNSGIRMSNTLMSSPILDWPMALERIQSENDVIVAFDRIPQIMSGNKFLRTYGDIESAEYYAELGRIEAKIDELALHRK